MEESVYLRSRLLYIYVSSSILESIAIRFDPRELQMPLLWYLFSLGRLAGYLLKNISPALIHAGLGFEARLLLAQ